MSAADAFRFVMAALCLGVSLYALVLAGRAWKLVRAEQELRQLRDRLAGLEASRHARDAQWGGRA